MSQRDDLRALSDAATDGTWVWFEPVNDDGQPQPFICLTADGIIVADLAGTLNGSADAAYIVALVNAHRETLAACATCGHGRDSHSSGGMCDGDGTECYCVRFPDAPDFAASPSPATDPGLDVDRLLTDLATKVASLRWSPGSWEYLEPGLPTNDMGHRDPTPEDMRRAVLRLLTRDGRPAQSGAAGPTVNETPPDGDPAPVASYEYGGALYRLTTPDKGQPDLGSEYGRLLAERDRLIADGADPDDLETPVEPR